MNPLLAKFIRSVYRKEPISGFLLILGLTDAVIGGVGERWSLLSIGLVVALLGMAVRWKQAAKTSEKAIAVEQARYLLPPTSSRSPLPLLMSNNKRRQ
ncbi:MAG: hypothetical protein ACFCU5_18110 [Pleurocapsa sp.]